MIRLKKTKHHIVLTYFEEFTNRVVVSSHMVKESLIDEHHQAIAEKTNHVTCSSGFGINHINYRSVFDK